jgi:hypothetical protein
VPFGDGQKPSVTGGHLVKLMTSMHRGEGVPVPLNATLVEQYGDLGEGSGNRPLVFLNACQVGRSGYQLTRTGGFRPGVPEGGRGHLRQHALVGGRRAGAPVHRGVLRPARGGIHAADAATTARQKCRADGDSTWLAYVVYDRPDGRLVRS